MRGSTPRPTASPSDDTGFPAWGTTHHGKAEGGRSVDGGGTQRRNRYRTVQSTKRWTGATNCTPPPSAPRPAAAARCRLGAGSWQACMAWWHEGIAPCVVLVVYTRQRHRPVALPVPGQASKTQDEKGLRACHHDSRHNHDTYSRSSIEVALASGFPHIDTQKERTSADRVITVSGA